MVLRFFSALLIAGALIGVGPSSAAALTALPGPLPLQPFATCASHSNQKSAQQARDTRDADGDGIYCESLPCPCAGKGSGTGSSGGSAPSGGATPSTGGSSSGQCTLNSSVYEVWFSKTKYANIRAHFLQAARAGWPQILVINRPYADSRRDRLLQGYDTRSGHDRDEYPPAMGRGRDRKTLMRGTNPRGWMAHVAHVPSSENRSHGSLMGAKLRRFCDGQKFRYRFY